MKYYRSKATGRVYPEGSLALAGVDGTPAGFDRVTVKPWKPRRLGVGDRVVTTESAVGGAGRKGTIAEDDKTRIPFLVKLDAGWVSGRDYLWATEADIERRKK